MRLYAKFRAQRTNAICISTEFTLGVSRRPGRSGGHQYRLLKGAGAGREGCRTKPLRLFTLAATREPRTSPHPCPHDILRLSQASGRNHRRVDGRASLYLSDACLSVAPWQVDTGTNKLFFVSHVGIHIPKKHPIDSLGAVCWRGRSSATTRAISTTLAVVTRREVLVGTRGIKADGGHTHSRSSSLTNTTRAAETTSNICINTRKHRRICLHCTHTIPEVLPTPHRRKYPQ